MRSCMKQHGQTLPDTVQVQLPHPVGFMDRVLDNPQVRMESLAGCQLGISIYPTFSYNASGGGGVASATQSATHPSQVDIVFDPKAVSIPDVTYSTAKVGGVPLLPMFRIRVQPESLQVIFTRQRRQHAVAVEPT